MGPVDPLIVAGPLDPVDPDSTDPSSDSDSDSPDTEIEIEGAAGPLPVDSDDPEIYFSPKPSKPARTPRAPGRAKDLHPPAKFRAASLDFREYRGSIEFARSGRSTARTPSPSTSRNPSQPNQVSRKPARAGILGDFKDFVLGPQSSTGQGPQGKQTRKPDPTERRTRAAGPALQPEGLPPATRPGRGRGAKK